jgi:Domain of unknown function (DUF5666)
MRTTWHRARTAAAALALGALALLSPAPARAESGSSNGNGSNQSRSEIKLKGFVAVAPPGPGGTLTLPLPAGAAPVVVTVSFGVPAVTVPVTITPATQVEVERALPPVTIADGDALEIEARLVGAVFEATRVELEDFPELELRGTVQGLPAGGVSLPLGPSATLDFTLFLGASGLTVPIRVTSVTRLEDGPFVLTDGALIDVEAVIRDSRIVATELELEGN